MALSVFHDAKDAEKLRRAGRRVSPSFQRTGAGIRSLSDRLWVPVRVQLPEGGDADSGGQAVSVT